MRTAAALAFLLFAASAAQAQMPARIVERGKAATALVVVQAANATGTAFCVSSDGYFVTDQHVTDGSGGHVMLLIRPGEAGEKQVTAQVIREDKDDDLSLLKVSGAANLVSLSLGSDDGLMETDPVIAFGFPFGTDLALTDNSYPSVSVSVGHITALRRDKDGLEFIQLDASLNPGNSGGPVLDANGRVISVVEAGIPGAALNLAIPVHILKAFLQKPVISWNPPVVTAASEYRPQTFRIHVASFFEPPGPLTVTLTLSVPGQPSRTFTAAPEGGGEYAAVAAPRVARTGPKRLLLTAHSPDGPLTFHAEDQDIQVGGRSIPMSEIKEIRQGDPATVTLRDGASLVGRITGLAAVSVTLGGVPQTIRLSQFPLLEIEDAGPAAPGVSYAISVRAAGQVIGELAGTVAVVGSSIHGPFQPQPGGSSAEDLAALLPTDQPGLAHPSLPGVPTRNAANGHWYQAVSVPGGLGWHDAYRRAAAMTDQGRPGHLATLTTPQEAQWVVDHFPDAVNGPYWLGGYQDHLAPDYSEPAGGWRWVTGEPWSYTRWNRGLYQEPNNADPGHEDYLTFSGAGNWNDVRESGTDPGNVVSGFLVEYE